MTDTITVRINGKPIETTVDEEGTQRLPNRPIIRYLMHRAVMNFNELGELANIGMVSVDDYRFVYQNIGFDLSRYVEVFPEDEIDNPLWNDGTTGLTATEVLSTLTAALQQRNRDHDTESALFWADELERTAADMRRIGDRKDGNDSE